MATLDKKNGLFYIFGEITIDISKLYENGEFYEDNVEIYPDLKYEIDTTSFILKFNYKDNEFSLFMNGIKYNLYEKNVNGLFYSFTHLKMILDKYKYIKPIYRPKSINEFQTLENPETIENFNLLDEIIIKEKKDDDKDIKDIYDMMNLKYNNVYIYKKNIELDLLSVNLQKYFSHNININLSNKLTIYKSNMRLKIFSEVRKLLKSKDKIFAICGPFGIGKSFTSLLLQKYLYFEKINSIYVNLSNDEEISSLKKTLIKESFFLNLSKNQFTLLANKIFNYKINSIWDIVSLIDNYCNDEKINYLLILDQYKDRRDPKKNIFKLKVDHIFLLSSINDKDVKKNLVSQIEGKNDFDFKYFYYINLGINYYILKNSGGYDNDIINCLKDFNYLPNTIFLLDNVYNGNLLDLYNQQYWFALKKISKFFRTNNISYLSRIITSKKINDSKTINRQLISKDEFLNNINDIPLKYISYEQEPNKNYFALYYAFDYAKYPLENEVNNYIAIERFNSKAEASLIGGEFENILKHKFLLDRPLFEIDSFIIVNEIIEMELSEEYRNLKSEYLKQKKCIFISQSNFFGKDYDFAILYPASETIILIQAKYKITSSNIHKKSEYSNLKSISTITNSISQKLGIDIKKIYLLYISSLEFNYRRKNEVLKILNSKMINCIFYSINDDYFSYDFENHLTIFLPTESMEIYPESNIYVEQFFIKRRRTNELLFTIMKDERKLGYDNEFISNQYKKFRNYLDKTNIDNELKKHLGNFESPFLNNYRLMPNINFDNYLLFFKINPNKEIDFSTNIILTYEDNNNLVYYNIKSDKKLYNFSIKNNMEYKNYYYIVGNWIENESINLEEN